MSMVKLQMMTTMMSEEEIINDAIKALNDYKDSKYHEDKIPMAELIMAVLKIQQKGKSEIDIMREAVKHEEIINKVTKEFGEEAFSKTDIKIKKDKIRRKEHSEESGPVILLGGEGGNA